MATEYVPITQTSGVNPLATLVNVLEGGDETKTSSSPFTKPNANVSQFVPYFCERISQMYTTLEPTQIETLYSMMFQMVARLGESSPASLQSAVEALTQTLSVTGLPYAPLRLRLLTAFFNTFEATAVARHPIYLAMLRLIRQENLTGPYTAPLTHNAEGLISQWTTNQPALRTEALYEVYKLVEAAAGGPAALFSSALTGTAALLSASAAAFASTSSASSTSTPSTSSTVTTDSVRDALYAYLNSVDLTTVTSLDTYESDVEKLIRYAIRTISPASAHLALDAILELPIVSEFKNKPETDAGAAYRIGFILCFGSFAEFKTEMESDTIRKYMSSRGLALDWLTSRMTGMLIAALAEDNPKLSYAEVAQAIDAKTDDEVEIAVVDAATSGILEAHLNQQTKTIRFDAVKPRAFSSSRWRLLEAKLTEWKRAITQAVYTADTKIKKAVSLEPTKV